MSDFDQYIQQGAGTSYENAQEWRTAIGLQQVDGLKPSSYLLELAKRNIEGELTIDQVQQLIQSYYEKKEERESLGEEATDEADKVSVNIKKILREPTFAFSANGFVSIHRRIFSGVMKHAGELRSYNITKKEFILRGDTVLYLNWEDLYQALEYDIQKEKNYSYKSCSEEERIEHLSRFVADLWQIHPFCEGNTRTTAVFLIQYLRSLGYQVDNELFANHSWYFRNALVRANYKNVERGIENDYSFLKKFFENLLKNAQHELRNRHLVINTPVVEDVVENKAPRYFNELSERQQIIYKRLIDTALSVGEKAEEGVVENVVENSRTLAAFCGVSERTIQRDLAVMQSKGIIRHEGSDKGGSWKITGRSNKQ